MVTPLRWLPAKDRPGKQAWLGPVALALAVISWITPVAGPVVAGVAIACAGWSMFTAREYQVDWTAAVGAVVGLGQLGFAAVLFALSVTGH
ncbi:hypothetical protein CFN78_14620 [Amycolatopsis antarctica]|uniref:Uncharacterized protein n=1 Tax=Amycolatopsis antarctica TaxID=1854586 RepID=A0A263D194_9PSEU|nr:hypothetical protein [Amycolatopsis antarctica]OZM72254.1 hypothetical protein CFN78_14620 [Amycolatopsis antarctica]